MITIFSLIHENDKAVALKRQVATPTSAFLISEEQILTFPGAVLAYWASPAVREVFRRSTTLEELGYKVHQGLITSDDARFLRLRWEVEGIKGWVPFAKGSTADGFLSEVKAAVNVADGFRELIECANEKYPYLRGGAAKMLHADPTLYGSPGIGYTRRTTSAFRTAAVPAGLCFSDKLPLISQGSEAGPEELMYILGVTCSKAFSRLVEFFCGAAEQAARSYETGFIGRVPLPLSTDRSSAAEIADHASSLWRRRWRILCSTETSPYFLLPEVLASRIMGIPDEDTENLEKKLDDLVLKSYGLQDGDLSTLSPPSAIPSSAQGPDYSSGEELSNTDYDDIELALSWAVGVAFGRFDVRLATGEYRIPPEPGPFDPLGELAPATAASQTTPRLILVDDAGHRDDIELAVRQVLESVSLPEPPAGLRKWLRRDFFSVHLRMYSANRRKAPIYWQLATASGGYSAWLYLRTMNRDALYSILDDYARPKLSHEEQKLSSLREKIEISPSPAHRKLLAAQESFVEELRGFLEELKRVAPLWNPCLEDGVIINFAVLWRLVPNNRVWQKDLKTTWDALCAGEYEWAHLAMHLWPERIVPKCATDRSLAIAHGLEDIFWTKGEDGRWRPRATPARPIEELVRERTSLAVKAALKSLIEAPMVPAGTVRGRRGRTDTGATA